MEVDKYLHFNKFMKPSFMFRTMKNFLDDFMKPVTRKVILLNNPLSESPKGSSTRPGNDSRDVEPTLLASVLDQDGVRSNTESRV